LATSLSWDGRDGHARNDVLICGAGIAGLGTALALADGRRRIVLVERDPPPPEGPASLAFENWQRRGVSQFRHSHVFLGRLTSLLRRRHPVLLAELLEAGARLRPFAEDLPASVRAQYRPLLEDDDLASLMVRRSTFECVLRRHVEGLPGITILSPCQVRGLIARRQMHGLVVEGVKIFHDERVQAVLAGIVIDATGRMSRFPSWLRAQDIAVSESWSPGGVVYFSRYYRLADGAPEMAPVRGDLGYLRFDVSPADSGHVAVTLVAPESERALRRRISKADGFEAACREIPACAQAIADAAPAGPVRAMAGLDSMWRSLVKNGKPQVLNFFAVGDASVRSNPVHGRGCSTGFVHAHLLADVLARVEDPAERALAFERETKKALEPHHRSMMKSDARAIARSRSVPEFEDTPPRTASLLGRIKSGLTEDGLVPALESDMAVLRAFARAAHMIDGPLSWQKRPALLARVVRTWLRPKEEKQREGLYPPPAGPGRNDMMKRIGLAA
jgi:2-polyprenyl-6-methoxyphenol hydroxylase-like FAD-dependent oxidoreductase